MSIKNSNENETSSNELTAPVLQIKCQISWRMAFKIRPNANFMWSWWTYGFYNRHDKCKSQDMYQCFTSKSRIQEVM